MGRYIHIRSNVNNFYPFRIVGYTADNTFTTFNKMTDGIMYNYCKGFNDDVYAIERDNTTKQHYLLKLDV
jgi:hypothetical protein